MSIMETVSCSARCPAAAPLNPRVRIAIATGELCAAWLAAIPTLQARCLGTTAHALLRPHVEAFSSAWMALAALEAPHHTVETALGDFAQAAADGEIGTAAKVASMLRNECVAPLVRSLAGCLIRDPAMLGLATALGEHAAASEAAQRVNDLATQDAAARVASALQAAADRGVGRAEMQSVLDRWAGLTGALSVIVRPVAAAVADG